MTRINMLVGDLCRALLVGGLGAVFVAAFILFEEAPSREVAGRIGNALFAVLGPGCLAVTSVLTLTILIQNLAEGGGLVGRIGAVLAAVSVLLAACLVFVLTPEMDAIWRAGAHAPDGSGLMGEDRARFMSLHGMGSAAYLGIWLVSIILLSMRSLRRAPRT